MKILVACEESQVVTIELRKLGHEAYSCDIQECSGNYPEWHLQQDVIPLLEEDWDMIIAFPPCTHLSYVGSRFFKEKIKDGRQQQGIDFFMLFANSKCKKVAIENPLGIMSTIWRKADQIIQPYQFGDSFQKRTCLWLKGLPLLKPTKLVSRGKIHVFSNGKKIPVWFHNSRSLNKIDRIKIRSKTFPGIARAMAIQWTQLSSFDALLSEAGMFG